MGRRTTSAFGAATTAATVATVATIAYAVAVAAAAAQTACTKPDRATTASSAGEVVPGATVTGTTPASASLRTTTRDGIGRYLTDANGRSLYMFARDTRNESACVDACAAAWPPLAAGARAGDAAVRPTMLGAITRADTGRQTTYNGMPVYYYEDDKRAGDIEGQGKLEFGGRWYLVSPSGRAIEAAAPRDR